MRGRWPRLQHYGAAGDINGHAGMLNEEVLQGVALEAGRPNTGPLCSKTGGRGNKPALIHQGGCGWRAACRSRRGPRIWGSCVAVYRGGGSCGGEGAAGVGHTHTDRTRDGERKGIVSQTYSPVHRAQRAPEGQGSYPAALGGSRCKPQQIRRQTRLSGEGLCYFTSRLYLNFT